MPFIILMFTMTFSIMAQESQSSAILKDMQLTAEKNLKSMQARCAQKDLSAEEKKYCEKLAPSTDDVRLVDCEMDPQGTNIVCGEKVYLLSGKADTSGRESNKKIDMEPGKIDKRSLYPKKSESSKQ